MALDKGGGGNDAMGGFTGSVAEAHACTRRPGAAPESRLGERRLDVGFARGRQCRLRQPAAGDLAQLRLEELDGLELEYGGCWRGASAGRRMALAGVRAARAEAS